MGALDVKRRQWSLQLCEVGHCVIVLQLFLGSGSFVNCALDTTYYTFFNSSYNSSVKYDDGQLAALQSLWGAWNASKPDLPGWNSTQPFPCKSLSTSDSSILSWRGVLCVLRCNATLPDVPCSLDVVGMSISNASIGGVLPEAIGNLNLLTTLELTGNPNLAGPLPSSLHSLWSLSVLDLRDNGFDGNIPDLQDLWNILQLDLSGNQITGEYPWNQTSTMNNLQVLSVGNNRLTGLIPADVYQNKTDLEKLDISDNFFNGTVPNLSYMTRLRHLDVSGNNFEGQLPDLTQFPTLSTANFGGNKFNLGGAHLLDALWNVNATSAALTTLNLSYNQLNGSLSSWTSLTSLGSIQELYLDNNTLSGTLDITMMFAWGLLQNSSFGNSSKKLKIMSLTNNRINDVIHNPHSITNITTIFKLQGNPYCDKYDSSNDGQRCYCTQRCYITTDRRSVAIIAAVSSVVAVLLVLLVVVGGILVKNRRYRRYLQLQFEQKFEEFDVKPTIFSYNELRAATRDFHEDMKLGLGSYGAVYKGVLPNGNVVAVKQLHMNTTQGLDEFSNEVVLITGMKHRNLVNLKGCCLRENQRLLVYEYVDNYDVDQIFLGSRRQAVSWPLRLKICLGIARGLHYLHALAHPRVIHRDIKASNVLLDKSLEPKIADFGLALLFPDEQSHIMTVHVAGTKGYLAPEYAALGQLSDKVDVYSFGVLCLEIISGRRNIDTTMPLDEMYLTQRAWNLHERNMLMELIDPTLQLSTDEEVRDVLRVINMSLLCIQTAAEKRPTMARVVSILQSDTESEVQVLGSGKGERPSYESLMSQKSVNYNSTSLENVSEEAGSSSSDYCGKSRRSHGAPVSGAALDLSELRAR